MQSSQTISPAQYQPGAAGPAAPQPRKETMYTEEKFISDELIEESFEEARKVAGDGPPAASEDYQRILQTFRATAEALIKRAELPDHSRGAVLDMMGRFSGTEEDDGADDSDHHKEIRAERFTLVDDGGAERARLRIAGGDAVLTMMDSRGRPRLRLRAGDKEAMITICGERGEWGKGVLSSDDEAERIRIGYESSEQDASIALLDGNELECALLALYGAEGDGFIRLRQPRDGLHCVVDIDGLIACDGDGNTRPACAASEETAARPAATD